MEEIITYAKTIGIAYLAICYIMSLPFLLVFSVDFIKDMVGR